MAGWNVEGTIRNGTFFLSSAAPTRDAGTWLDVALERPLGRWSLLEAQSRVIAIGPVVLPDAAALGAAVTTYAMFDDDPDYESEEKQFVARLADARLARGLPAPVALAGFEKELLAAKAHVHAGGTAPKEALDELLEVAAWSGGAGTVARGYVLETNDLEHIEIPNELLTPANYRISVAITHHRAEGAAWGQYVLFAILVEAAGAATPVTTYARGVQTRGAL
jgi:hypothetical protein